MKKSEGENNMANKKSFALGKSKKYYLIIGTVILGIAVAHFGVQMIFIQKENLRSFETALETENIPTTGIKAALPAEQISETSPEQISVKKSEEIVVPEVKNVLRRKKEVTISEPKIVRKKEVRETRAERLRRTERLLTGV